MLHTSVKCEADFQTLNLFYWIACINKYIPLLYEISGFTHIPAQRFVSTETGNKSKSSRKFCAHGNRQPIIILKAFLPFWHRYCVLGNKQLNKFELCLYSNTKICVHGTRQPNIIKLFLHSGTTLCPWNQASNHTSTGNQILLKFCHKDVCLWKQATKSIWLKSSHDVLRFMCPWKQNNLIISFHLVLDEFQLEWCSRYSLHLKITERQNLIP